MITQHPTNTPVLSRPLLKLYNLTLADRLAAAATTTDALVVIPTPIPPPPPDPTPSLSSSSRWADPESPENLRRFIADVESLGSTPKAAAPPTPVAAAAGLRVAGSKRAWKQTRAFGRHFDKQGVPAAAAPLRAAAPPVDLDVDQLVCNALADSLLELSRDLLARACEDAVAAADIEDDAAAAAHGDDTDVFGSLSALGLLPATATSPPASPRRRRPAAFASPSALLLSEYRGAVEALYSGGGDTTSAVTPASARRRREQVDRLFSGYPAAGELSALVLQVAAARRNAAPAAVVVEQLVARGALDGDGELFRRALDVMNACAREPPGGPEWQGVRRIFVALRPRLLLALVAQVPDERARAVRAVELGALAAVHELPDADEQEGEEVGTGAEAEEAAGEATARPLSTAPAPASPLAMEAVQALLGAGVPLKAAVGSELIASLLRAGDVDAALALAHWLLQVRLRPGPAAPGRQHSHMRPHCHSQSGQRVGDGDCQELARRLLARGRQDVALALCRLSHSRGTVGPPALYAALFDKVLRGAASVRGAGFGLYLDAGLDSDRNSNSSSSSSSGGGGKDPLPPPAVQTCVGLLREIAAVSAPAAAHKETVAAVAIELISALRAHGLDRHAKAVSAVVAETAVSGRGGVGPTNRTSRWRK